MSLHPFILSKLQFPIFFSRTAWVVRQQCYNNKASKVVRRKNKENNRRGPILFCISVYINYIQGGVEMFSSCPTPTSQNQIFGCLIIEILVLRSGSNRKMFSPTVFSLHSPALTKNYFSSCLFDHFSSSLFDHLFRLFSSLFNNLISSSFSSSSSFFNNLSFSLISF